MILPAIDLIDNKCVRLTQGDYNKVDFFKKSPLEIAKEYEDAGFEWLHLVDLEGAKNGEPVNLDTFLEIRKKTNLKIQYGGGIRSEDSIEKLLSLGVERVLISTLSIREKELMIKIIKKYGQQSFAFCWDGKETNDGFEVFDQGWLEKSHLSFNQLYDFYKDCLPGVIFVTDINRDGMMTGANVDLYKKLQSNYPQISLGASGGVSTIDEVESLRNYCKSVIVGKALLNGQIDLGEASKC